MLPKLQTLSNKTSFLPLLRVGLRIIHPLVLTHLRVILIFQKIREEIIIDTKGLSKPDIEKLITDIKVSTEETVSSKYSSYKTFLKMIIEKLTITIIKYY